MADTKTEVNTRRVRKCASKMADLLANINDVVWAFTDGHITSTDAIDDISDLLNREWENLPLDGAGGRHDPL